MRHFSRFIALAGLALAGFTTLPADAGIVITGTRAVYPAQSREITVSLTNEDKKVPRLVQAWIDDGNEKTTPDKADVPFNLTPPVFRMEPGKSQSLRIVYTKEPLPADKESLFWLNVLEVPPKPTGDTAERNSLQFAFRTRIKLFFRPANLASTVEDAPKQLTWSLGSQGAKQVLEVRNPTPYYVSFQKVALDAGGKLIDSDETGMVAPGGTHVFPLKDRVGTLDSNAQVRFSIINDAGGFMPKTAPLKP
ncbi:fimbria/pilus periplasmic chaperone [Dyella jejuensis]|uniref:Fimbria/pilus periplasmic chaperone n=1 Tax=Dyella jejuensis TaxID=1432009 RepID=A0ABW8JK32_9GAMM